MASESENTYGDIQMNERYKRLKRNLKLALIKGGEKRSTDSLSSFNASSIDRDNLDISSGTYCVHSKNGSEVVSSSANMRNILSYQNQKWFPNSDGNINKNDNIATSTVKSLQFPLTNDVASRTLMPPPKSIGILAQSSRNSSLVGATNSPMITRSRTSGTRHIDGISSCSIVSSIECPSSTNTLDRSPIIFEKETESNNIKSNFPFKNKPDRVFSKWRVMLNDTGKLIIKGTLECGKVARSKPVICRLSAISVQSIFNHIYNLNGNIYDEKNELPNYIRGKFFNGFPDDWENVYQLWRNYVAQGSNISFRWPTPITDSDDEIKSGITEEIPPRIIGKRPQLRSDSLRNHSRSKISERFPSKINQSVSNEEVFSCNQCGCSTAGSIRNESIKSSGSKLQIDDDKCDSVINGTSIDKTQFQESTTSFPHSENINVFSLKDVLQEDKINIILENMNSKNCTVEYIDKVFQMYDCFKYIFSHRPESKHETGGFKSSRITTADERCSRHDLASRKNSGTLAESCNTRANTVRSSTEHTASSHRASSSVYRRSSKRIANMRSDRNYKPKIRGRLTRNKYDNSKLYDNDSDYDTSRRSNHRILQSHSKRKKYRRSSMVEDKSSQTVTSTSDNSEDDDYVPKKINSLSIPAGSGLYDQMGNIKTSTNSKQIDTTINCTENPRDTESITRCSSHQLEQETIKDTPDQRYSPEYSMSTIGGFIENNDSCESITEEESKVNNVKQESSRPNINYKRSKIDKKTNLKEQSILQHKYTNYDSSVSITDDEYVKVNEEMRNEMKGQVLQEVDAQNYQQTTNASRINLKQSSYTSQVYGNKNFAQSLIKIPEVDEKFQVTSERVQQKSSPVQYVDDKKILNDNKENCMTNATENKNKLNRSFTISHELKVNDEIITVQAEKKLGSPEEKKKPIIVRMEKTSIDIESLKKSQSQKSLSSHIQQKDVYGSESNPKQLAAWVPRVLHNSGSDYGLIFEGKLLNEANHVLHRKFTTDFVVKRISLKIIKTESNEFYELVGDLTDTKHSIPKELLKLCFNGCPSKIPEFCKKWKELLLESKNSSDELLNVSKTIQGMPMSSRGRRILPPLCYWTGERVALKDNQTVYSPGNSINSTIPCADISFTEDEFSTVSKRRATKTKNTQISTKKNSDANAQIKDKNFDNDKEKAANIELNIVERSLPNLRSRTTKTSTKNREETVNQRGHQRTKSNKRRLTGQLSNNSTDSDNDYTPAGPKKQRPRVNDSTINMENEVKKLRSQRKQTSRVSAPSITIYPNETDVEKNRQYKSSKNAKNNEGHKVQIAKNNTHGTITYMVNRNHNRDCELSDDPETDF